jgi:hypothetical protein
MGSRSSVNIEFIFETVLTLHRSDIGDLKIVYKELFQNSLGGKLRERAKKKNFKIKYGENKEWISKECRKLIAEIGQYLDTDGNNEPVRVLKKVEKSSNQIFAYPAIVFGICEPIIIRKIQITC